MSMLSHIIQCALAPHPIMSWILFLLQESMASLNPSVMGGLSELQQRYAEVTIISQLFPSLVHVTLTIIASLKQSSNKRKV
jgi:hypothetical protein